MISMDNAGKHRQAQQGTGKFYNRISFLYPFINYFLKAQRKRLIQEVNSNPPGKLLEIGIGTGVHLPLYAGHQITGIDLSEAMLKKAMKYQRSDTVLLNMDGEDLSFEDASYDYVVLSHVIAVTKNPDQLLAEVYRVLKPGGRLFILNHFTPDNWLGLADRAFQPLSSFFHFRSSFHVKDLQALHQFSLLKQTSLGKGSYYKLLIFFKL